MITRAHRTALSAAGAAVAVLAPRLAAACSVCSAGRDDETQAAFLIGTVFLSVLPLALIGGIVLWLRGRVRRLAAEEAAGVIRLPEPPARPRTASPRPAGAGR